MIVSARNTSYGVVLDAPAYAALASFGTSVKIEKGAKMAAFQTGVVLAAGAEAGKQAINHFLYGKGRGKHGPRGVPVEPVGAAQPAPEVQEKATENTPIVNEEVLKPAGEQPLNKAA
ncbi:MAG: hypothetical protein RLZZ234_683 [Candidatus Parcubacteria bacterium]